MNLIHRIALIVLAFEMPVPVYWIILHRNVEFWRRHVGAGYLIAIAVAWGVGDFLLYYSRAQLFRTVPPSAAAAGIGVALMAADFFTFVTAEAALGGRRLVGHAELSASGGLVTRGLYTRVRHPRYLGMIAGVIGASIVTGSLTLWITVLVWLPVVLGTLRMEERELRNRFGAAYADYARRVPALLPVQFRMRANGNKRREEL